MALPHLEKIDTAIVVLSGVDKDINLSAQEVATVIREPTGTAIGQPPEQVQITSLRDQVMVTIAGGKLIFQDKSDVEPGTSRLPDIVYGFLTLLERQGVDQFAAYGINFDLAFDARGDQPASEIIAERYVNRAALSDKGQIAARGAGLRLYFSHANGAVCDMKVEPRFGKADAPRFFAHINYHFELPERQMPPLENLKTMYHGLWPQFTDLLDRLFIHS